MWFEMSRILPDHPNSSDAWDLEPNHLKQEHSSSQSGSAVMDLKPKHPSSLKALHLKPNHPCRTIQTSQAPLPHLVQEAWPRFSSKVCVFRIFLKRVPKTSNRLFFGPFEFPSKNCPKSIKIPHSGDCPKSLSVADRCNVTVG